MFILVLTLLLGSFLPPAPVGRSPGAAAPDGAAELGTIEWGHDFELALDLSRAEGKPVLLLFQEVPGCQTCVRYGTEVLSHPLLVEAAEDLFIPTIVYNNRSGPDAAVLARFSEPAWNNPVLRFLDASGNDIIERETGIYDLGPTVARMIRALRSAGRPVPTYLELLALEESNSLEGATFGMSCFWVGEARLGFLEGVVHTRPGFLDGLEVVDLTFDPHRIDYKDLVESALTLDCASRIFAHTDMQFEVASGIAPSLVTRKNGPVTTAARDDHYFRLRGTSWLQVDLIEAQKTKVNAAVGTGKEDPEVFLSPRQRRRLAELQNP